MSILTVAYMSDIVDNKVLLMNSQGGRIHSNSPKELLDFLATNYTDALNRKMCWNLDAVMCVILQRLGIQVCKELIKEPDCEVLLTFSEDGKPVIHPLTEKPERGEDGRPKPLPNDMYSMYYHATTSVGLQVGSIRKSFIYNLCQYFEGDEINGNDLKAVLGKANEFVSACFTMGLNPLKMSSAISIYQSNILDHIDFPTIADLPRTLPEEDCDELVEWAEEIMHREWTTNLAVGRWYKGETFNYDVQSSYGYHFSELYNFKYATFTKSNTPMKEADWGILKGRITINPDVRCSPICYKKENGQVINPVGVSWVDKITLADVRFMYRHKIGTFELDYGYFWKYNAPVQPFNVLLNRVFNCREQGGLVKKLSKRIGASAWAKCIQRKLSGDINKFYNPIFGCQVKTNARLQVANFIYDNDLQDTALYVATDGIRATKEVAIPKVTKMGAWKLDEPEECIILSPGRVHSPTHHPQSLYYQDIVDMIEAKPKETYYSKQVTRRLTLGEAVMMKDLKHIGELAEFATSIDLIAASVSQDFEFKSFPRSGGDLLNEKYYGEPVTTLEHK